MLLDKLNHFQKFNLEAKFSIDELNLETTYLKLQRQFHPDSSPDQTQDQINSILINQAYQILKNPIKRAIYLLQLNGINIDSEECLTKPSTETLMLIMEIREEIFEAKNAQNPIDDIRKRIKKMINDEIPQIANSLAEEQYEEAAQKLIKVKYLDKIIRT